MSELVCFSLLGTWQGQPWDPDHSTLLQLLVSIQAMIFNDQPYYNEPGYELRKSPVAAQKYNRTIEALTVRHAMIPWLADRLVAPDKPTGTTHASPAELSNQKTLAPTQPTVTAPAHQPWANPQTAGYHGFIGGLGYSAGYTAPPYSPSMATPGNLASLGLYHGHPTSTTASQSQPNQPLFFAAPTHSATTTLTEEHHESVFGGAQHPAASGSEQAPRPSPGGDDPVFGVIVREHFRVKASSIVETVHKWERLSKGLAPTAKKLEELLDQHGFND
jgi:baculoviral IAP repeat-containing protein 6